MASTLPPLLPLQTPWQWCHLCDRGRTVLWTCMLVIAALHAHLNKHAGACAPMLSQTPGCQAPNVLLLITQGIKFLYRVGRRSHWHQASRLLASSALALLHVGSLG